MENQSSETKLLQELDTLIRARYTLLAVNTYEEERLKECLLELVPLEKHREKPLYFWSRTNGIVKIVDEKAGGIPLKEAKPIQETQDPLSALEYIAGQQTGIFLLCDFAPYTAPYGQEDPVLVRLLREVAWKLKTTKATVLFAGPNFPDIKTLEKEVSGVELDLPVEKSEQFSGAEIEGAVKDAVLEAFIDGNRAAGTKDVVAAIGTISPTAEMMKTKVHEIREWAKNNIKGSRTSAAVGQSANTNGARVLEI